MHRIFLRMNTSYKKWYIFYILALLFGLAGLSINFFLQVNIKDRRPHKNGHLKSHPGLVFLVASKIAKMRGITVGDVLKANRDNVRALYGIRGLTESMTGPM